MFQFCQNKGGANIDIGAAVRAVRRSCEEIVWLLTELMPKHSNAKKRKRFNSSGNVLELLQDAEAPVDQMSDNSDIDHKG